MRRRFVENELQDGPININDDEIEKTLSAYFYGEDYVAKGRTICDTNAEYSLQKHQRFAAEYIKKNSSVLIFHGLGSGKTCTSVATAELFKKYDVNSKDGTEDPKAAERVIITCPAKVVATFEKEIRGKCAAQILINDRSQRYATDDEMDKLERNERAVRNAIRSGNPRLATRIQGDQKLLVKGILGKVSRNYDIISHDKLYLQLFSEESNGNRTEGQYTKKGGPLTKPGTLLIIDEVQNLVSLNQSKKYKAFLDALTYYAHPDIRIMLMSATPVFNRPFELALTMNLLRPEIPFPSSETEFNEMFEITKPSAGSGSPRSIEVRNADVFKFLAKGKVSYFAGGNPAAYPYVINTYIHSELSKGQMESYREVLKREIEGTFNSTDKIFGEMASLITEQQKKPDDSISLFQRSQQSLLCDIDQLMLGIKRERSSGRQTQMDMILEWSVKFHNVITLMDATPRPVFVYMTYVERGLKALKACLLMLGKREFNPAAPPLPGQGKDTFALWHGGTSGPEADVIQEAFNSNRIGLILSTVEEGVSFLNVGQVHIVTPWWNDKKLKQVAARAIRFKSHCNLPKEDRFVHVFYHLINLPEIDADLQSFITSHTKKITNLAEYAKTGPGTNNDDMREAINQNRADTMERLRGGERVRKGPGMYQLSYRSIDQIMERSSQFKMEKNNLFELMLKETAVDAKLNANANVVQLRETYMPLLLRTKLKDKRRDRTTEEFKDAYVVRKQTNKFGAIYTRLFKNPNTGKMYTTNPPVHTSMDMILNVANSAFQNSGGIQLWETTEKDGVFTIGAQAPFKGLIYKENIEFSRKKTPASLRSLIAQVPELGELVNKGKITKALENLSVQQLRSFLRKCLKTNNQADLLSKIGRKNTRYQLYSAMIELFYPTASNQKIEKMIGIWDQWKETEVNDELVKKLMEKLPVRPAGKSTNWKVLANEYIKMENLNVKKRK